MKRFLLAVMAVLALEGAPGTAAQDIDILLPGMERLNMLQSRAEIPLLVSIGGEWGCPCASRNSRSGRARCSSAPSGTRTSCTAWDDNPSNCAAAARAICGLTPFEGVLPVSAGGHSAGFAAK